MEWRMKAILGLLIVLEAVNCAQLSLKDARIDDLEGQQIINRSRLENWQTRAMRDEQTIEDLQKAADEAEIVLPDGLELVDAGEFECTAYCGEKYPHICGEGKGITASGAPFVQIRPSPPISRSFRSGRCSTSRASESAWCRIRALASRASTWTWPCPARTRTRWPGLATENTRYG